MRWGVVLLLVAFLIPVIIAKDGTDSPPSETNGNSTKAHSGVPDDTNADRGKGVHEGGEFRNETSENHKMDNLGEGTSVGRDEPVKQSEGKLNSTTKSPQEVNFLQDPLIKECDPSHRCIIEKKKFIACLKVPGEDSLALSLLIDNKGMDQLDVSIVAPPHVNVAEAMVLLKANEHQEVPVSIGDVANDTVIVLKVSEETCNLNLHSTTTRETTRVIRMRLTSTYVVVPAFVLLGLVGLCFKFRRMHKQDGGPVYQKLDMELPVSTGGKKEPDQSDQWDNNWGDDWDDEESPLTPSKPIPNLSSKGLAPRRSTKDGWKD